MFAAFGDYAIGRQHESPLPEDTVLEAGGVTEGGWTLTQQLVKNYYLTNERTLRRKVVEAFMAIVLERRLSKDQILELYLNDVSLGQRGSFAIHGVPEAARLFFAKDVSNLSLSEAATEAYEGARARVAKFLKAKATKSSCRSGLSYSRSNSLTISLAGRVRRPATSTRPIWMPFTLCEGA